MGGAYAANVTVTMNSTSTTMSLVDKVTGQAVEVGEPTSKVYTFEAAAGTYVLTGYGTNGTTSNGTIEINVTNDAEQTFTVQTVTAYASNSGWVLGTDYSLDVTVNTKEGTTQAITLGSSTTAGRATFLALNGNSYFAAYIPSEARQEEGYMTGYKSATLTSTTTASMSIPKGEDYTVTVPADAQLSLGMKFTHFTKFTEVQPIKEEAGGNGKILTYRLALNQVYNYRTWKSGGLTQAGYFTMSTDAAKRPTLAFTDNDYAAFGAKTVKHDTSWNGGYETGDIYVNINERGHLKMNVGETFDAHAIRTWELIDNTINNYFIEPDFHYTVIDVNGNPSTGVIEIENADTTTDPWSTIKAVGNGTAIVLVTYDAIGLNNYNTSAVKNTFVGGEYWSAIWPENTAAYVVTVGEGDCSVVPNMTINVGLNNTMSVSKVAGDNVDAEHDVFYYLAGEDGAHYTFTPEGAAKVEIAYPVIGEQAATYKGFGTEGVTKNEDGSYTLLLKEGRQIVRLTDAAGKAAYQVLTAKSCTMEITNATRPDSKIFQPGDQIKVQYTGLRHPSNKLAGIYNMSAKACFKELPTGATATSTTNQYLFGNTPAAQAVTITVPETIDTDSVPTLTFGKGSIEVTGFGDPYGNHREIGRFIGRAPNFTAKSQDSFFGMLPSATVTLSAYKNFTIKLANDVEGANYTVALNGKTIDANEDGTYTGTFGTYTVTAGKAGYRCYHGTFDIADDAEGDQTFNIVLTAADATTWDGVTTTEPEKTEAGVYQISTGAELAWFAANVNTNKVYASDGELVADIDLGDYTWSPIGTSSAIYYGGTFNGNNHAVKGLYINDVTKTYLGLFGYVRGGTLNGINVYGEVRGKQYVGGLAAYTNAATGKGATIDRCANFATVYSASTYAGGITSYLAGSLTNLSNCYNVGDVTGVTGNAGGVVGYISTIGSIANVYNIGEVTGAGGTCACVGSTQSKEKVTNAYSTKALTLNTDCTLVTEEQMASGEIAYKLGEAFGQHIGVDAYPVIGGMKVLYDEGGNRYYNATTGIDDINAAEGASVEAVYDLSGRQLNALQHGINIVRMSDGTVRKVLVK
jgi:hypothetical protein